MHIKQRLQINSLGILLLTLAIVAALGATLVRVNRALDASRISTALFVSSHERLLLRTDSHRTGSERTKLQLIAKHREIGALLQAALKAFPAPQEQRMLHELISRHDSIGYLSKMIRERRDAIGPAAGRDRLSDEAEDLLLSQLNTNVYESVLLQGRLLESSQKAVDSSLRMAAVSILAVLLLVASLVLVNSVWINRLFAARIESLRRGTTVIGGGDLEHRIVVEGNDEFGELAASFNDMTAKLSRSYHEKEREIEDRKRAESALRQSEFSFRMLVENNPNIIGRYDRQHRYLYLSPSARAVTGQPPESFLGKSCREMGLPPELCRRQEAAQDKAFAGERVTLRLEMADTAGRRRVLLETMVPEVSPDGSIDTVLTIAQDITELIEAQEEKEVLLKEIHHRVKNNLQVISSLVSLQAGTATDQAVREILDEVSYRVRSMALVHEKLYQSSDLAHIDFADYLDSLLAYIWRAHGSAASSVRLTLDLEPVFFPVDTAVPCGLMVNELASNVLKHAFKGRETGEVTVSLKRSADGATRLTIADNGVGLPEGLDWRKASSLGLRLVQMLAGQLDAEVTAETGQGTAFEIIMNRPPAAVPEPSAAKSSQGASRE